MERSTKKLIRIVVIAVLVIGAFIFAIIRMNLKPADDYKVKLEGAVAEAEGVMSSLKLSQSDLEDVQVQSDLKAVTSNIEKAKSLLGGKASKSDLRGTYEELTAALENMKKYENSSSKPASSAVTAAKPASSAAAGTPSSAASGATASIAASSAAASSASASSAASSVAASSASASSAAQVQSSSAAQANTNNNANAQESSAYDNSNDIIIEEDDNGGSDNRNSNKRRSNEEEETDSNKITCTIEISCKNLLGYSGLEASKKEYVPSDGTILKKTTVKVEKDTTVFDVLKQVCSSKGIHLASRFTPAYDSYYIEGINHLFEFDGGEMSGWIYKVNGTAPNYGCSSYKLKDGDTIYWGYTVNGVDDV